MGQDVDAKILNIDETGKIRLSIGALGADDERGMFEAYKSGQGDGAAPGAAAPAAGGAAPAARKEKPAPRNFGTLADLLPKGIAAPEPKKAPAAKTVTAKGATAKAPAAKAPAARATGTDSRVADKRPKR